jgi:Fic family protein
VGSYERIQPLPPDYSDPDASAIAALAEVWRDRLQDLGSSRALQTFNEQLYRRWAIETGILERLYSLDRGVTQILVERGLDVSLIDHSATDVPPEELVRVLRDHREAVQYVMNYVMGESDLSLHFIRSIHQILTRHQTHVDGLDQFNRPVQIELLHGDWKKQSNNPTRPDGVVHPYCPPALVQEEMERLVADYAATAGMPSVTRSAWLHHRFTQIHPFQDGNGRVARALAAFALAKDHIFPIVIERDHRTRYIECLEQADAGDLHPLIALWSDLERQAIEGALSLADSVLVDNPEQPQNLLREKLLSAISDRAAERKAKVSKKQKQVLATADTIFDEIIAHKVIELRDALNRTMRKIEPNFSAAVDQSDDQSKHWFKTQFVEIAEKHGYFCDQQTYHRWVRLKMRHSINEEHESDEVVLSLHSLGRKFAGVLALSGYFAEREFDPQGRSVTGPIRQIADRPLSFAYREKPDDVRARVADWLDMALNVSLEHFRREL